MAVINSPPITSVDIGQTDSGGGFRLVSVAESWRNFFVAVYNICNAQAQSGTTANRPTTLLWPGRRYFDTDLGANGKPIFVKKGGSGWVLADGTAA